VNLASSAGAESSTAAALAAASGDVSEAVARAQSAASTSEQQQLTAVAAAAGTCSPVGPLLLLLHELVLEGPCTTGSIPRALQSSPQLSVLEVNFAVGILAGQLATAAHAVATMETLEEVTLTQGE
jgi:hypothetical protein